MEESVLELVTMVLTEKRITDKVQKSEEYKRAKEEEGKVYDELISNLNGEQKRRLDDFIGSTALSAAVWEKMAYQQGMKDLLELLKSLL